MAQPSSFPTPLQTADFDYSNIFPDFGSDLAIDSIFMQESFDSFNSNMDVGSTPTLYTYPAIIPILVLAFT